jgi:hypothetical protein
MFQLPIVALSMRAPLFKSVFQSILFACLVAFVGSTALAQAGPTGTFSGTVTDPQNAVVPSVNVTIRNVATNQTRTQTTTEDGRYVFTTLPVGIYEATFEKEGFGKLVYPDIEIEAAVPRTIDVALTVGEASAVVNVTSEAPLIQPESVTTSRQITGEEITQVPTSTRSFTQLTTAAAGVSADLAPVAVNGNGNISPSVNGTRTTATSLYFNGIDATNITSNEGSLTDNIAPAPETLQEVKLQTSLYDASTGRSGGGNFQLVTRQGGNRVTGNVYYYGQNKRFTANEFFIKNEGLEKPAATRNEVGFTLGGPVIKDKFFAFGGYQFTNARTGFVPTARSTTVLPFALTYLTGERNAQNVADAFNRARDEYLVSRNIRTTINGVEYTRLCTGLGAGQTVQSGCLTAADISPVALRILNLRNPVTGGFVLPTPRSSNIRDAIGFDRSNRSTTGTTIGVIGRSLPFGTTSVFGGTGVTSRTIFEDNPLVDQLNVEESEFEQHQVNLRLDGSLTQKDILSGTFFFANFPGLDSFPDPSSLTSPFTLRRADKARALATSYTRIITPTLTNELRFGYFSLDNTRSLDDPFLTEEFTNSAVGIINPAERFDASPGTLRLGHFIGRNNLARFSFGGPNDSFNKRKQTTFSLADNISYVTGRHSLKFGGEFRRYAFNNNLPEEQATEFEKFDSITQLLTGNATEADTQYGLTEKSFRFSDIGAYITDDWKVSRNLTLNIGLRYEFFGLPTEKDGRIGNFDFTGFEQCFQPTGGTNAVCDNIAPGFIVPKNVQTTGLAGVDSAIGVTRTVDNKHTLNGQDKNNFAPRFGAAYKVNDKFVIRGGYGLFYDRPSGAFINTVFSNYPFLREVEITVPSGGVPIANAFVAVPTTTALNNFLPFRVTRTAGATGSYVIRDATGTAFDPRGTSTGAETGNIAETFEFRAIDRDLSTPYVHQFNVGFQYEIVRDLLFEARYIGTRGRNLLQAVAFNQSYDLNDPNTPEQIFERFNQAYIRAGSPNGALNAGATARERGVGRAFGFFNPVLGRLDYNLANANGAVINFEARVPLLGFNVPEAVLLTNGAYSDYDSAQFILSKRFSNNLQFNIAYTFSKSIDVLSSDPGSTAGGGRPDVPNSGFVVQGDQRNLEANRGLSDFDRTHRFSASFTYDIPSFGSKNPFLTGYQISSFVQLQSGTPFTPFSPEPEIQTAAQYSDLVRGSGGLQRLGFGRPNIRCTAEEALLGFSRDAASAGTPILNLDCFTSPLGGNGNMGRNIFRGPSQRRVDLGLVKRTRINERYSFDLGIDVFNLFNTINFANPEADLSDLNGRGTIINTTGGPRLAQFRARFNF